MPSRKQPAGHQQGTIEELGTQLSGVTFCVFDLETTGGSAQEDAITEIGAVKVHGGEVVGEFATLVDPGRSIPPFIVTITGITDMMVTKAPRITEVLPAFLEFAKGTALVAHNAPFDIGFMKAACQIHGYDWPNPPIVDTADLARRLLTRDETPDRRLATLARIFRSSVRPVHRALTDARATVDVLHGLLERAGGFGLHTLEELKAFARQPTPEQQRKRHLADDVPEGPGVYAFRDAKGEALYIGKSGNLRNRVRSYFTGSETRDRIREMVGIAEAVTTIQCATTLEAEVRELRLIASERPRYNRRSKFPERALWVKLTVERFPRLSIVNSVRDDGAEYLGPFPGKRLAEEARLAIQEAVPLRRCTGRLPRKACALYELGRCGAPCEGLESASDYDVHVRLARLIMRCDARPVAQAVQARIDRLAVTLRYEEAASSRDRLAAYVRAAARMQRLAALAGVSEMVAARPAFDGGWELHVIRHGRLAAAGVMPRGAHPVPAIETLTATAETVIPGPGPCPAATAEETECILRWLSAPGVRLAVVDGTWTEPVNGAARLRTRIDQAYAPVRRG